MGPLAITCQILGRIAVGSHGIALDALLQAAVAMRDNLPPLLRFEDAVPIEIPVKMEPGGRFYLASVGLSSSESYGLKFTNRRFPIAEAQTLGSTKIRRVLISGGPCKSYRIPLQVAHLRDDELRWYCVGDAGPVLELLRLIGYLGKRRAVGLGRVRPGSWRVESCEPWGPGFPVVDTDGQPLRTLPPSWLGLSDAALGYANLTPPYPDKSRNELCALPRGPA